MSVRDYYPPLICAHCAEKISRADENAGLVETRWTKEADVELHKHCAPKWDSEQQVCANCGASADDLPPRCNGRGSDFLNFAHVLVDVADAPRRVA